MGGEDHSSYLELAQVAGSRAETRMLSDPQQHPWEHKTLTSSLNPPCGTKICLCVDLPIHTHHEGSSGMQLTKINDVLASPCPD